MPRQQTLAASVEWSYELLDDVERRVLRRLGVFAGPFSLLAAEAVVTAPGDVDAIAVFDTISRLVDKSLVLADDPDGAIAVPAPRDDPGVRRQPGARGRRADGAARHPFGVVVRPARRARGHRSDRRRHRAGRRQPRRSRRRAVVGRRTRHRARPAPVVAARPSVHGNGTGRRRHAGVRHAPRASRRAATPRAVAAGCGVRGDPRARVPWPAGLRRAALTLRGAGRRAGRRTTAKRCRGGCWGCRSPPTGSCCGGRASTTSRSPSPWPTVRLAIDAALDEPDSARDAMREADAAAAAYHSRYIRRLRPRRPRHAGTGLR